MAKSKRSKTRAAAKSAARKTSSPRKSAAKKSAKAKPAKAKSAKAEPAKSVVAKSRRATTARGGKAARASARPAKPARTPQRVAVSHYSNADFESGLRAYAQYRDLGIVDATDGMVRAHVLRFTEPCDPAVVSKLHFHDTEFQMVYVLKGWVKTELEGQGEIVMRQGSAWTQPPMIKHKINDYSEDAELLEIILPADFGTEEITI